MHWRLYSSIVYRCALPAKVFNSTDTWHNQSASHTTLIDRYIPTDEYGKTDSCNIYSTDDTTGADGNRTKVKCDTWVYDISERDITVVSKVRVIICSI